MTKSPLPTFPTHAGRNLEHVEILVADVSDQDSLDKMAGRSRVVLNCVGPVSIRIRLLGLFHEWLLGTSHYRADNIADKQEHDAVFVKCMKMNKTRRPHTKRACHH